MDDEYEQDGEAWDYMDEDQTAQMESGIETVTELLGRQSTITLREIKSALWESYFAVDEAVDWLLQEQSRKEAATKKAQDKAKAKAAATAPPPPKPKANPTTAGAAKPVPKELSQLQQDMDGMNLTSRGSKKTTDSAAAPATNGVGAEDSEQWEEGVATAPVISLAREKILEEVKAKEAGKPALSLVVVGHVDAGKSTLMGRVLHELGETSQRALDNNERQAQKIGKGSFALAWSMDALEEERERGVTIDIAVDSFTTDHRRFTLLDAPGHRDFIPNMISGAAQADAAILVVDGAPGAFEKGFEGGGQTREHARLVRSLGVRQVVVAVNKLDAVEWSEARFEDVKAQLTPFLAQSGFQPGMVTFLPVAAMSGENVVERTEPRLKGWYSGPTLVQELDRLEVPPRALEAPLRIPLANVFRGQTATASGLAVAGRIESGVVQVGERLAALPGDESGVVRALEVDGEMVPWAVAGANVTVFLSGIDANQLSVGSVLCPPTALVPCVSTFTAQIMLFDLRVPITAGAAVELFHHSRDVPATITALEAVLDKSTGEVLKANPRMLTKNSSARVQVALRPPVGGGGTRKAVLPLEAFQVNKGMGRVLFRRGGETVGAGIVVGLGQ